MILNEVPFRFQWRVFFRNLPHSNGHRGVSYIFDIFEYFTYYKFAHSFKRGEMKHYRFKNKVSSPNFNYIMAWLDTDSMNIGLSMDPMISLVPIMCASGTI